ncbi:hypothetical protein DICVIV_01183 [Dictyocaulus viviparus]|uniref:Uncharacterized protein n=1 Tax=Dictyocaulus viviparus TaxID=29172 RepID=A0A0D8Y6V0_DICVI|nr:hypothetical protein DICVIV_01183 [Dictyocaulus viviparus]
MAERRGGHERATESPSTRSDQAHSWSEITIFLTKLVKENSEYSVRLVCID